MRQTTVMIKNLLFTFTLLTLSTVLSAQVIDEDNTNLTLTGSGVELECDNLDQGTFDSEIEGVLDSYNWTNSDGLCNGSVTYVPASFDYGSWPLAERCGDPLSIDLDIDCDGTTLSITVEINLSDNQNPVWPNNTPADQTFECDDMFRANDIDAYLQGLEANVTAGDAEDNCTDSGDLIFDHDFDVNSPTDRFTPGCSAFAGEIEIDITLEDECGNIETWSIIITLEDTEVPEDFSTDGTLDDPNETAIPCDILNTDQEIQDWIDDILVNGDNTGRQFFNDCVMGLTTATPDPTAITITLVSTNFPVPNPPVGLDYTVCVEDASPYEAVFNVDDGCGNDVDFTFTFDIEDATEPDWPNGDNFYDTTPFVTCEFNVAGVDHDADYAAWVQNIINTAETNGEVTDECTAVGELIITADPPTINFDPTSCDNPPNIIFQQTVTFTATDLCGNTSESEHLYTIEDVTDPVLDFSGWTQTTIPDCDDFASIEAEVTNVLLSAGVLSDDCSDLSSLSINDFSVIPDHTSLGPGDLTVVDNNPNGPPSCYEIVFDIEYEDACGNLSNIETMKFEVKDDIEPDLGGMDPLFLGSYCPEEIMNEQDVLDLLPAGIPLGDIAENCTDIPDFDVSIWDEFYPDNCGETGYIEWEILDQCGNPGINGNGTVPSAWRVEWQVDAGAAATLDWIGDPTDFLPPEDITVQFPDPDCTNDFDPCMWTGMVDGSNVEEMWIWEMLPNVHYSGGCDVSIFYSHTPCSNISGPVTNQNPLPELVDAMMNSVLTTEVCVQIVDNCSAAPGLEYCFDVTVQCGSCGQFGNIYCATCEESKPPLTDGGCKLCDPVDLANGYDSCTPPCDDPACPILGPPQPGLLCDSPGFVPHNMSWFAFVASGGNSTVEVFIFNCIGAGVQSGIYSSCEYDEPCVGFNVNCSTNGTIDYNANFIVGQTYYMFVDGCNGSECEYTVTVDGLNELVPDDMDAITAYSECKQAVLTDDFSTGAGNASESGDCDAADFITVCPGELIQFGVIHQGNQGNFPDNDEACDEYALLDASFEWSASWGDTYSWNPFLEDNDEFIDIVEVPSVVGDYNICLDFIDYECYPVIGPKCLMIKVVALQQETYEYAVCVEDLDGTNNPNGWFPGLPGDDPNMDGIPWLGDFDVTLTEVDLWPERADGYKCMSWEFLDPDCNCIVPQELCLDVVGDRDKTAFTLYLWECQVTECRPNDPTDCDPEGYDWVWDWNGEEEVITLYGPNSTNPPPTIDECFRIPGYHTNEDDWKNRGPEFCDTIPQVTVMIAQPLINIDTFGCGQYCLDMDKTYDDFSDDFEDWPQPFPAGTSISFVDCDDGSLIQDGECIFLTSPRDDICISVYYEFNDGAWWDGDGGTHPVSGTIPTSCSSINGPFDWGVDAPNAPVVTGDDTFCSTDLLGHEFMVVNPNPQLVYEWNMNPVMAGVVVTDISTNGDGSVVSIDLPAGWGDTDCVNVRASGQCDPSDITQVCFNLLDPPTVAVNPIDDICITGAPDGSAVTVANVSATANPPGANYIYTWTTSQGSTTTLTNSTTLSFPSAGTQTVSVLVTDTLSMCSSLISLGEDFEVIDPIPAPLVSCGNQGQTTLEITWLEIPGATGYTVIVDGAVVTPDKAVGELSHTESGLTLGQTVEFVVVALGVNPCFNSAPSIPVTCETSNCPPASITQEIQGQTFCENATIGVVDIAAGFPFTEPNGELTYTSTPANLVDDNGLFDTDALTAGTYTININFTFDPLCPERNFTLVYNVSEVPDPSFEIASPICVTSAAAITGTPPGVSWDYDGGVANQSGEIEWTIPGTYTVKAVSNVSGCLDSTERTVVVEAVLEPIVIECPETGLDFVMFDWNDIAGATAYDLVIIGGPMGTQMISGHPDSEISITNLMENDNIEITVTALSALPGCNSTATTDCTAGNCTTFPDVSFIACDDDIPGMVTFGWRAITGIDSFRLIDPVTGDVLSEQVELSWTINNLGPNETVSLIVEAIHPEAGCPDFSSEQPCTAPCPGVPMMGTIACETGLDFVTFTWAAVTGVTQYEVTTSINGRPSTVDTVDVTTTAGLTFLSMLNQDDEVEVFVVAINPDSNCGNGPAEEALCIASNCDVPVLDRNPDPICYEATDGVIDLFQFIGDIEDANGVPLNGFITFQDPNVDPNTGEFTPTTFSDTYDIDYTWVDASEPACEFPGEINIQINVRPTTVDIDPIDPVCAGVSNAMISAQPLQDPEVVIDGWDFDGGNELSGSSWGTYEVEYTTGGTYTVSLSVSTAPGCDFTVTEMVEVGEQIPIVVTCGTATNDMVTIMWDPIPEAFAYQWSVEGGSQGNLAFGTSANISNVTGGSATVTVIALFDPPTACGSESLPFTITCPTRDCPPATFVNTDPFIAGCINDPTAITLPGAATILPDAPVGTVTSETWTGSSTVDESTGVFDPSGVSFTSGTGIETINITYTIQYDLAGVPCDYVHMMQIEVYDAPFLNFTIEDPDCALETSPSLTLAASGGTGPYTYELANNPGATIDPMFIVPGAGSYDFIATDANGCTVTQVVPIAAAPEATVTIDGPAQIFSGDTEEYSYTLDNLTIPVNSVVWYINDVPYDPAGNFQIEGLIEEYGREFTLKVEVYFAEDCFRSDERNIKIIDIEKWYIPNVVSPEIEGENNSWDMFTRGSVTVKDVSIYDRWGELVFVKTLDPTVDRVDVNAPGASSQKWDLGFNGLWGETNNVEVEIGVYVYVINLVVDEGGEDERPEIEAGDITVIR